MPRGNCQFSGTGGQYFPTVFIHLFILSLITFGLYSAWAWVRLFRLKASHTTINDQPVTFTGTGGSLFVLILIQGIITMVTLGFYFPWAFCKFFRWRAQNTLVGGKAGQFTGTGGSLFFFYLIHLMILPMLTLGIYSFLGLYRLYAWKEEHTRYGGKKTSFGSGFGGFLKVSLIGYILNAITVSLFSPWSMCMLFRWQINGLAVGDEPEVEHFSPVKTNVPVVIVLIIIGLIPWVVLGLFVKSQFKNLALIKSQIPKIQIKDLTEKKEVKRTIRRASRRPSPRRTRKPAKRRGQEPPPKTQPKPAKPPSEPPPKVEPAPRIKVDYEKEMKRVNDLITLDKKNTDALYTRGWLYAYKGDLQKAEKDYSRAIELNNRHEDAYYNRGLLSAKMKKYEQAVRDFNQVIELKPEAVDALCNRGSSNFQMGKLDLALEDFNAAFKINPNDADIYYNRAVIYLAMEKKTEAMADFKKAAQMLHDKARKELPGIAPAPPSLKKSAADCRVMDFLEYMPTSLRQRVQHIESIRSELETTFDEFYQEARRVGGKKVRRIGDEIRFLADLKDPQWRKIIPPQQLKALKKSGDPLLFKMHAFLRWKEECEVLKKFQACVEDPRFCKDHTIEGSALEMRKVDGAWRLVEGKLPVEWDQALLFGKEMVKILQWAKDHLMENEERMGYNQLILSMGAGYVQRLLTLSRQTGMAEYIQGLETKMAE